MSSSYYLSDMHIECDAPSPYLTGFSGYVDITVPLPNIPADATSGAGVEEDISAAEALTIVSRRSSMAIPALGPRYLYQVQPELSPDTLSPSISRRRASTTPPPSPDNRSLTLSASPTSSSIEYTDIYHLQTLPTDSPHSSQHSSLWETTQSAWDESYFGNSQDNNNRQEDLEPEKDQYLPQRSPRNYISPQAPEEDSASLHLKYYAPENAQNESNMGPLAPEIPFSPDLEWDAAIMQMNDYDLLQEFCKLIDSATGDARDALPLPASEQHESWTTMAESPPSPTENRRSSSSIDASRTNEPYDSPAPHLKEKIPPMGRLTPLADEQVQPMAPAKRGYKSMWVEKIE